MTTKPKKVTISSFLILSIYKIQQLACWFISQLHSDAEAAQRQEEHEACFFVMGPPYRNRAKQNQKKRQMGDQINLEGSFLEAEEPCLNLPVTVEGQHRKHRAKIGKKKPRLVYNLFYILVMFLKSTRTLETITGYHKASYNEYSLWMEQ